MKKITAFILAVLLTVPALAHAANYGIYVTPKIGGAIQSLDANLSGLPGISLDNNEGSFGGGLAVGYDFNTNYALPLRAELEYMAWTSVAHTKHFSNGFSSKAEVCIQSLFANIYLDWHNSTNFTPYVGAGLGMGFVDTKGKVFTTLGASAKFGSHTDTNFAWNVGLGCSYAFTDSISADLSYRYASFGDGKSSNLAGFHINSNDNDMHQFLLGIRFTF